MEASGKIRLQDAPGKKVRIFHARGQRAFGEIHTFVEGKHVLTEFAKGHEILRPLKRRRSEM